MTVNLDLALSAGLRAFARPITVTPQASQPARVEGGVSIPVGQPYEARAVWASRPIDVQTEQGIMSSQEHKLGIRALDFEIPPAPGDLIEVPAYLFYPRIGLVEVEDGDDDGQGGTSLSVKVIGP